MFNPEFLTTDNQEGQPVNGLIQYLQDQSPDVLQRVAKSASPDIQDIIRHNVQGLLGMLPGEQFEVKVTSNRDNLANMLASAMMTGYFLRQMEQRKELEETLFDLDIGFIHRYIFVLLCKHLDVKGDSLEELELVGKGEKMVRALESGENVF